MILCECEQVKQNENSPSVVDSDEDICRLIHAPQFIDLETKTLKPAAFQISHFKTGVSVNRKKYLTAEIISKKKSALEDGKGLVVVGKITVNVGVLRKIVNNAGLRVICIKDDGEPDDPSHAVLVTEGEFSKGELREARLKLQQFFSKLEPIHAA